MSLLETFFPVVRRDFNFFDNFRSHMENEFLSMEQQMMSMQEHMDQQMSQMRNQMFQLLPYEPEGQAISEIKPTTPIVEEKGETKLKLDFNVHGFKPEEVKVKVLGNNILQVHAKSDTKNEAGESHRLYVRQYSLPDGVKADQIKPTITKDGVLTIEAPAPHLKASERLIPIKYTDDKK